TEDEKQGDFLSFEEKKDILKEHILASVKWLDGIEAPLGDLAATRLKGIIHSRRHLAVTPVFKGIPNFRETRIAMLRAETLEELFGIIDGV
ncbi:MAG: tRNA dihydrouridine synthase DusB, partial [Prevotellaceae bacterium]|nr:tRNA dihydrouridine synthase DusB [Prevotellaceae bacterium]